MYLLEAPPGTVVDGFIYGHRVLDGKVIVSKQYFWHLLTLVMGWRDITPPWWGRSRSKLGTIKSVLHIHHCAFGDMLFLTSVFKAYAEKYPGVIQTVETNEKGKAILKGNPWVSHLRISKAGTQPADVDEFDDVISYDGMLARSPESELKNVYDLAAEWAGIGIRDQDKRPYMYFEDSEVTAAEELLPSLGIKNNEPYIMLQYDSSSKIRCLPYSTSIDLAEKIAGDGMRIILFGSGDLGTRVSFRCSKCGWRNFFKRPVSMDEIRVQCLCGQDAIVKREQEGTPGLHFLDSGQVPIRTVALLIARAAAFIGPDSSGLHLAACFDRPAMGIFFSFDGDLRTRYYQHALRVQLDVPCGPCFQYGKKACRHNYRSGFALCVEKVTADELYLQFTRLLAGDLSYGMPPFRPSKSRACPVCLSEARRYVRRKKTVCYYECPSCSMIYRDVEIREPLITLQDHRDEFQIMLEATHKQGIATFLHKRFFTPGATVLEVGCGPAHTLAALQNRGWVVHGLDTSSDAVRESEERYPGLAGMITRGALEDFETEEKFTLIWMNKVFERFPEPRDVFRRVYDLLEEGGICALQAHDGDCWRSVRLRSRWDGVITSYAGEHAIFPNEQSLRVLAELTGFQVLAREKGRDPDCLFMTFRKGKGEPRLSPIEIHFSG
jgi:ADP-heptose:LPS heptosyltransferase/SAM-dependent methyltransferase